MACPQVFNPDPDVTISPLHLADCMVPVSEKRVLDVGTGTGVLAILAALRGAKSVIATDFDESAAKCASNNVALKGLAEVVEVIQCDLLPTDDGSGFDVILVNLPFEGDRAKLAVLYGRLLKLISPSLDDGAVLQVAWASFGAIPDFEKMLKSNGLECEVAQRRWHGVDWLTYTCRRPAPVDGMGLPKTA